MSVYYESLCPDSIRFVTQQLYPNWLHFGPEILTVDLNPFGKANVSIQCSVLTRVVCTWHVLQFSVSGSGWDFTCQHGPDECRGNKVQACVLDQVTTIQLSTNLREVSVSGLILVLALVGAFSME